MLPPLVLRPPLGPIFLRSMVLALAAIFHVFTAGWSLILNGAEGDLAGAARVLLRDHRWLPVPTWGAEPLGAPLLVWCDKISMGFFGANEFAARLPVALAFMATVWFTMQVAERQGGLWRGFTAGMILLCSPGAFTVARLLTPAPLGAACLTAALYCLVCGSRRRPGRRQWYLLAWTATAVAAFSAGWYLALVPLGTVLLLIPFYREARIRFRRLLSWEGLCIAVLVATGTGWVFGEAAFDRSLAWESAGWLPALLFPWSVLLIPAAWDVGTRLIRRQTLEWEEAVPLAWMVSGVIMAFVSPTGAIFDSLVVWPAFAIWAARRLETLPHRVLLRALGAMLFVAAIALLPASRLEIVLPAFSGPSAEAVANIPRFFWSSVTSVAFVALLAFGMFGAVAWGFEFRQRRRFAVLALFGAMIPAGYAFADVAAKFAPYFSFADFARTIDASRGDRVPVLVDGPLLEASSLRFYLNDPFRRVLSAAPETSPQVAAKEPVFLITRSTRLEAWTAAAHKRFRPESESGGNVLYRTGSK